jgi:hypothetical protein
MVKMSRLTHFILGRIGENTEQQSSVPIGLIKARNLKRFIIAAALLTVIALSVTILINFPPDPDVLYPTQITDAQRDIIRFYFNSQSCPYPGKIVRWNYVNPIYGTINNCIVFIIHPLGKVSEEPWQEEIAGYTFEWDHEIDLFVYRDVKYPQQSGVCTLKEAYKKGWLTEEQIGEIYKKHIEYRTNFPQMLEEWKKAKEEKSGA